MKNLSEELIVEILLNLPIKSLLRFRCVSKRWRSLISNPQFAKLHFERTSTRSHRLLYTVAFQARSIDFNAPLHDDSAVVRLDFPLSTPPVSVRIMGSCRGFLLLVLDYDWELLIWNPSTVACKRISQSPSPMWAFLYGFGYDSSTDDYLVVLASYDPNASVLATHFEMFSLKANSWKKLEVGGFSGPYINLMDDPMAGSLFHGAIHWLALRINEAELTNAHGVIIAFNLIEKNLKEVAMPADFNDEFCDLGVFGGCLGLIDMNSVDLIEIWLMREYGVKSSWTKSMIVSLDEIPGNYLSPICYTKGGEVVGLDDPIGLVKCNNQGVLIERRDYCHDPQGFVAAACVYTESLLSFPSDHGEEAEENRQ